MKLRPSLLLSVAIAGLIAMSSCTKSYTCHCVFRYSGYPGLQDSSNNEYTIIDNRKGAANKCAAESKTYDNNRIHTVETCYLY